MITDYDIITSRRYWRTKTILRLVKITEGEKSFETVSEAIYPSGKFPDLVPMVKQFLSAEGKNLPEKACLAIAGPVINNTSKLTNLGWSLSSQRLETELEMERVRLINDFAAISYGILGLDASDLHNLQPAITQENSPIAVLGAGTGLGEAFLVPQGSNYQVFATEGGHTDFAPHSELEWQLSQYLQHKYNTDHVSVERVVSGQGIVAIYQFLRDQEFAPQTPEVDKIIKMWEENTATSENSIDPAATIAKAAIKGSDRLSVKTMEIFVEAYGAEAGNLALQFLPYGGLYIAGGIAAKILPLMQDGRFMRAFKQKGRVSSLTDKIPVNIILNPQVGLLGSVLYALS